jgi:hypothetical protein
MKQKVVHLVPRSAIRVMFEGPDVARLVRGGDWLLIPEHLLKPPTRNALAMRRLRAKRRNPITCDEHQGAHTEPSTQENAPSKTP